jgi:hypothetical protein
MGGSSWIWKTCVLFGPFMAISDMFDGYETMAIKSPGEKVENGTTNGQRSGSAFAFWRMVAAIE